MSSQWSRILSHYRLTTRFTILETEIETVTLSIDKARELAHALLSVVDAIEFVKAPKTTKNLLRFDREFRRSSGITR